MQTSYAANPPKGYPGMVVNGETSNRISRTVENSAGVAFGRGAFRGSGQNGCTGVVGTAANFLGFTIADHGLQVLAGGTPDVYRQYASAAIMTQGVLYVVAGEAVTQGAPVYIDAADGDAVDTATDNIATGGWVFDEAAASGAIVRIAKR